MWGHVGHAGALQQVMSCAELCHPSDHICCYLSPAGLPLRNIAALLRCSTPHQGCILPPGLPHAGGGVFSALIPDHMLTSVGPFWSHPEQPTGKLVGRSVSRMHHLCYRALFACCSSLRVAFSSLRVQQHNVQASVLGPHELVSLAPCAQVCDAARPQSVCACGVQKLSCVSLHVWLKRVWVCSFFSQPKKGFGGLRKEEEGPALTCVAPPVCASRLGHMRFASAGTHCLFGFPFAFCILLFLAQAGWRSACCQLTPHVPGGQTSGVLWRHSAGGGQ